MADCPQKADMSLGAPGALSICELVPGLSSVIAMASRDQRARLLALTRAAYGASEGVDLEWSEQEGEQAGPTTSADPPGSPGRRRARAPDRSRRRWGSRPRVQVSVRAVVGIAACLITVLMVVVARSVMSAQAQEVAPPASHSQTQAETQAAGQGGEGEDGQENTQGETPAAADEVASPAATSGSAVPSAVQSPVVPPAAVVIVHVAGHVATPGLVSLPSGSRVADALAGAGGATPEADLDALNLARVVVDGEQIYVSAPGEVAPLGGVSQSVPSVGSPPGTGAGGGTGESSAGPVNLNTADVNELDALPGVGPAIAGRIVAWREQHDGFTEVEELTEVSGIGPATLERLRPLVTV